MSSRTRLLSFGTPSAFRKCQTKNLFFFHLADAGTFFAFCILQCCITFALQISCRRKRWDFVPRKHNTGYFFSQNAASVHSASKSFCSDESTTLRTCFLSPKERTCVVHCELEAFPRSHCYPLAKWGLTCLSFEVCPVPRSACPGSLTCGPK